MPLPMLKGLAKKAGHSEGTAEQYWNEAKESAKKEGFQEGTPRFYRYTTGIVKRRLGIGHEKATAETATKSTYDPHYTKHGGVVHSLTKGGVTKKPMTLHGAHFPAGAKVHNLPGGVFVHHPEVKEGATGTRYDQRFGHQIQKTKEHLDSISHALGSKKEHSSVEEAATKYDPHKDFRHEADQVLQADSSHKVHGNRSSAPYTHDHSSMRVNKAGTGKGTHHYQHIHNVSHGHHLNKDDAYAEHKVKEKKLHEVAKKHGFTHPEGHGEHSYEHKATGAKLYIHPPHKDLYTDTHVGYHLTHPNEHEKASVEEAAARHPHKLLMQELHGKLKYEGHPIKDASTKAKHIKHEGVHYSSHLTTDHAGADTLHKHLVGQGFTNSKFKNSSGIHGHVYTRDHDHHTVSVENHPSGHSHVRVGTHKTVTYDERSSMIEIAKSKKWSAKATKKDKHDTPDKLFTHSGSKIAKYLHEKFGGAEAEKKINFYINRAGKNLHPADKKRLEGAKAKIQKHLKNAEKAETANSHTYKHHKKTKEEMIQHIENVKAFNELPFNEDQHKHHKKEKANVDDTEFNVHKDGASDFLQSNPDTDPTWGISHHASVEKDVDYEWNKYQKVLDEHHHQREAHGHREDAMEAWQRYLQHKAAAEHASDPDEKMKHHDLAERFKTLAQIQTQKWKKHVEES